MGPRAATLALLIGLLACESDPGEDAGTPYDVRVATAPTPAIVGPIRVVIDVSGPEGRVEGAAVRIDARPAGSPGIPPLEEDAEDGEGGQYVVPRLELPSGGDWIVEVEVELGDGTTFTHVEDLRVISGDPGLPP